MSAASGKSTCKLNGVAVAVGILKAEAAKLVEIHGQHEHQSLLDPARQLQLLDVFCGRELAAHKEELATQLMRYKETARAIKALSGVGNQRQEQIEIWRFQLDEIESANLKPNEEAELETKRVRLASAERLSRNASAILAQLYGGYDTTRGAAIDQTAKAVALAEEIARLDESRRSLHTALVEAHAQLADIAHETRAYMDTLDSNPNELERIESRLDTIYKLKKKYGATTEAVFAKRDVLRQNLDGLEDSEAQIKKHKATLRGITVEITAICDKMNALRTENATKISREITEILHDLGMQSAEFFIEIERKTSFGPDGNDIVEFMISPNPGEPDKPLRRIASGGEMSRVMLAIKTIMTDGIPTVIFDEVDTGVSGRTAQQVAEKLMRVSRTRQILCITHLPQIAAMADTHFLIAKSVEKSAETVERTVTRVTALSPEEINTELARLIGGAQITAATLEAAGQMKCQATELKV